MRLPHNNRHFEVEEADGIAVGVACSRRERS